MLGAPPSRKGTVVTRLLTLRRTVAAAVATPLLLTGLGACGSDSEAGDGAGAASSGSDTAALTAGDSVAPADFAAQLADGFAAVTTAHATVNGALGATGDVTAEGDVDYGGDSPAAAMTLSAGMFGPGGAEVRLVDQVLYVDLGRLSQGKFMKMDLDAPNSPFGALGSQLDPKSSVELLEKGMTSVTYVGEEGGLRHYTATVDAKALLAGLAPGAAGRAALPKVFDYDLWLDGQDRVNKLAFAMGDQGSVEMTLSDFGADVSIEAPPADQVMQMPGTFAG
jgi:hypothetical protein